MDKQKHYLTKDIFNLYFSYLSAEEIIYYEKNWHNFKISDVCFIAIKNGWCDLLIWAK